MAVRTANILAARGIYYFILMRIIMLTYQQPSLMLSERYECLEMVVCNDEGLTRLTVLGTQRNG